MGKGCRLLISPPRLVAVAPGACAVGLGMFPLRTVVGGCDRTDALDDCLHELHLYVWSWSFPGRLFHFLLSVHD